jgi:glycosyltransferase involved in cell wall biosynthesis
MKIAVVVHGRFHAFDLARALLARGHEVTLLTNYPRLAMRRFGFPPERVRSFALHGAVARLAWRARGRGLDGLYPEAWLHRLFGRWAARTLAREPWDAVLCWSGVAEETLRRLAGTGALRLVTRGSAHIRVQARLLDEESRRTGRRLERPSPWILAREAREYALADRIVVLSSFARDTFLAEGVPPGRVALAPPGARLERFRPAPAAIEARCERILGGAPLRVLNVGTFSLRKGMWDMAAVIRRLAGEPFEFRFVGAVAREARALARELRDLATFEPPRPEDALPGAYAGGDVFVLPTVEDGFGLVLLQAAAAGLPILTTPHGAGADLVEEGVTGWVLPVRCPEAWVDRLRWCEAHRPALAGMVRHVSEHRVPWDWDRAGEAFEQACLEGARGGVA